MSSRKKQLAQNPVREWDWRWFPAGLALAVLVFYAGPLISDNASIQWDAVDVHYSLQKYFSTSILHGKLPFWTPYSFSGMPILADPEMGAWYPLNWPFFAIGITPRAIQWELALHAAIACVGAWLLAFELFKNRWAAVLGAMMYGLSGFFAGHSSHVGIFQGAALFPWLLWSFHRALTVDWKRYCAIAAAVGAGILLAGHFQTAIYCFFALALFAAASSAPRKALATCAGVTATSCVLAAVSLAPALELSMNSIRAHADYSRQTNAPLTFGPLLTLFFPDFFGALRGPYTGPADITQFYFYAGILMPFLAAAGIWRGQLRRVLLALLIPSLWYALGPAGGFYFLIAWLPGFRSVRAPVHIWFVVALSLSLLAASGAQMLVRRYPLKWLGLALALVTFGDLWYWNMDQNPLAYARASFDQRYGAASDQFEKATATMRARPMHRFWAPADSNAFGPMNSALNTGTEATYGYNPLELQAYADYMDGSRKNPKLLNGLAVTDKLLEPNPEALPRVNVPRAVLVGTDITKLDPATAALVRERPRGLQQDASAQVQVTRYEADRYVIRATAASATLVRIAVPFFPGWRAMVDGIEVPVWRVDHALSGVVTPAGTHTIEFRYRSTWFLTAAVVSCIGWLCIAVVTAVTFRARSSGRPVSPLA